MPNGVLRLPAKQSTRKLRLCLGCGKMFPSEGNWNRFCAHCSARPGDSGWLPEAKKDWLMKLNEIELRAQDKPCEESPKTALQPIAERAHSAAALSRACRVRLECIAEALLGQAPAAGDEVKAKPGDFMFSRTMASLDDVMAVDAEARVHARALMENA